MPKKNDVVCRSKLTFTSEEAVKSHISLLNKEGILDYYHCKMCDNFHTTTLPGKNKISQRREHSRQKRDRNRNFKKFR